MSKKNKLQKQQSARNRLSKDRIVQTPDGAMSVHMVSVGKAVGSNSLTTSTHSNVLDPFRTDYTGNKILAPPYPLETLAQMHEYSAPLSQCIAVYTSNIVGFGIDLVRARWTADSKVDSEKKLPPEADAEYMRLMQLFRYANRKMSFVTLMRTVFKDQENCGMAYMEVVRNRAGEIATLLRLPAHTVRWTPKDAEWTEFTQRVLGEDGEYIDIPRTERFRRFVQRVNGKKMYFKEWGDPRPISKSTGKPLAANSRADAANEVIIFEQEAGRTTYPLPRWMPNMMGILGAHDADTVNYLFFQNKSIPPLIVTVSGGSLTGETVDKLGDFFEKEIKGLDSFERVLILEAVPAEVGSFEGEKVSPVKIEVQPLTQFIKEDARFLLYRDAVAKSIRGDYRLPPVLLGMSEDYNRATVIEAVRSAEEQVFRPERTPIEYIIQTTIMADMEIKYWEFNFLGGKTSDYAEMLKAIAGVKEMIPVGQVQKIVQMMLNEPTEDIPEALFQTLLSELQAAINERAALPPGAKTKPEEQEDLVDKLVDLRDQVEKGLKERKVG